MWTTGATSTETRQRHRPRRPAGHEHPDQHVAGDQQRDRQHDLLAPAIGEGAGRAGGGLRRPRHPPGAAAARRSPRRRRRSSSRARAARRIACSRSRSSRRRARSLLIGRSPRAAPSCASSVAPASPDFSGWNWVAHSGPFSTAATNRCAVLGPGDQRGAGAVVGHQLPAPYGVGVHEVEPLVLDAGEQRRCRRGASTVFQPMCGRTSALGAARPCPATRRSRRCPRRARRRARRAPACPRRCPSTGRPPASAPADQLGPVHRAQPRPCRRRTRRRRARRGRRPPARRRGRTSTTTSAPAGADPRRGRAGTDRAGSPTRSRGRRPCGRSRACPWWTGPRSRAGRSPTASRSARANALNCASTTWWALRPDSTRTCSAICAREGERLEDVPGQRAGACRRRRSRRTPARRARRCARSRDGRTGRPRPAPAPRRAARWRRRSGGCRPCRRAPRAAPAPSTIAVSSTVWWASMCGSPSVRTVRSRRPCLAELVEHVVEEADAGADVGRPVPSRSSSTRTFDSLVCRSTRAVLLMLGSSRPRAAPRSAPRGRPSSRRGCRRHPQPAVRTRLADQHAAVEQPLPDGVPVGEAAEQHEVRVAVGDASAPARAARPRSRRAPRAAGRPGRAARRRARARPARPPG